MFGVDDEAVAVAGGAGVRAALVLELEAPALGGDGDLAGGGREGVEAAAACRLSTGLGAARPCVYG